MIKKIWEFIKQTLPFVLLVVVIASVWTSLFIAITEKPEGWKKKKTLRQTVAHQALEIENLEDNQSNMRSDVDKLRDFINRSIRNTVKDHEIIVFGFDPEKGE